MFFLLCVIWGMPIGLLWVGPTGCHFQRTFLDIVGCIPSTELASWYWWVQHMCNLLLGLCLRSTALMHHGNITHCDAAHMWHSWWGQWEEGDCGFGLMRFVRVDAPVSPRLHCTLKIGYKRIALDRWLVYMLICRTNGYTFGVLWGLYLTDLTYRS